MVIYDKKDCVNTCKWQFVSLIFRQDYYRQLHEQSRSMLERVKGTGQLNGEMMRSQA